MLVGLIQLLHLLLGHPPELLAQMRYLVWMILHAQLPVGTFDLLCRGPRRQAEDFIILGFAPSLAGKGATMAGADIFAPNGMMVIGGNPEKIGNGLHHGQLLGGDLGIGVEHLIDELHQNQPGLIGKPALEFGEQGIEGGLGGKGLLDQIAHPVDLALVVAKMNPKEIFDGGKLGLGDDPVHLGNADQDIDQQKNELVVAFRLRLLVAARHSPDILGKSPYPDKDQKDQKYPAEKEKAQHFKKERGAAQGQKKQNNNQ